MPQDVALFHRSAMENLRYGRPDATDDDVRAAARESSSDAFIERLPNGYDTIVGKRARGSRAGSASASASRAHC